MAALTLTVDSYRDRVLGGWLGKSIGVTLGTSMRGQLVPGRFNYYSPVPGQPAAGPAIDFPLVWLEVLETAGPDATPEDFAVAWLEHLDYNQDEFGYAAINLRRGLPPPSSGAHSNWFKTSSGGVMRADLWAMVAPGNPQLAAAYAYHDAKLDHCEDGIWAAMFVAAIGSAAFFLLDPLTLLTIGLAMIPRTCRTARGIKAALAAVQRGATWLEARESVQHEVGHKNYSDVAQNMGFFTIGLFYGNRDFGASLCAATNCGYDAETVGGALGAVLGIQRGKSALPDPWTQPVGDIIIPGIGLRGVALPPSLSDVAGRTAAVGMRITLERSPDVSISDEVVLPTLPDSLPPDAATTAGISTDVISGANVSTTEPVTASASSVGAPQDVTRGIQPLTPLEPLEISDPTIRPLIPEFSEAPPPPPSASYLEFAPLLGTAPQESSPVTEPDSNPVNVQAVSETAPADSGAASLLAGVDRQVVSEAQPMLLTPDPLDANNLISAGATPLPDPVSAIAWADSAMVKPLLVTPPHSYLSHAGGLESGIDVVMNAGENPTISYNVIRSLSFTLLNRGSEPFSGRITVLAPAGWQISCSANLGQRQFIAANTGLLRMDFNLRVIEGQGRIDIANALTVRLTPEAGGTAMEAEFLLLGAACWWTVGPFVNFDGEGFDKSFSPEDRPGLQESYVTRIQNAARWERLSCPETSMDLEGVFKNSSGVCYGQTNLRSRIAREARIVANTNSGVKIWLNGVLIVRRMHRETFRPTLGGGPWSADVTLRAGDNPLMVKWVRGSEPYEFSLTVSDRLGRGLPDVGNTSF